MKMRWNIVMAALVMAAPVYAGGAIEEVWNVNMDCALRVVNVAGTVTVKGWDKGEIRVKVQFEDDVERVELDREAATPGVRVIVPKRRARKIEADVEVWLPFGASVDLSGVSADLDVADLSGNVRIHGVSGSVSSATEGGRVDVETVSGAVRVSGRVESLEVATSSGDVTFDCDTPYVRVESISGNIDAAGTVGEGHATTTSGRIGFKGSVQQLDAESISGAIRVNTLSRKGEVSTVSGNVDVQGERLERLDVRSVSGDINVRTDLSEDAEVDLQTKSGALGLDLPEGISARYQLHTLSGNLRNELGADVVRRDGPGKVMVFTEGDAHADVEMSSMSGNITLRAH